jgi:uncharacterized cupredoxin-like copper-binding protein
VPLALSTGHEIGLAVTAAVLIAFALASSFLFPRFRPNYPAGGLLAFIVISFVLFFGMLAAVEVFGVEEEHEGEAVAETIREETTTTAPETTTEQTTTAPTTTSTPATTTTAPPQAAASTVDVTETEFKIALPSIDLKAGKVTFKVKNAGNIPHDLAVKGMDAKTKLIPTGGSAELTVTLKPGTYELYCTVPGHEAAGMKLNITVS